MDDADRATLLAVVAQGLRRFDAQLLSYCLMSVAAGRDVDLWAEGLWRQIYLGDDEFVKKMLDAATPTARRSTSVPKEAVAARMGTTKSAVSRLEAAGKHTPSLGTLQRYAAAVGCELRVKLVPQR